MKNIVIIGGGCVLYGMLLSIDDYAIPSDYRFIVIEKHDTAHYMFAFPRASVIDGIDHDLFVPYEKAFDKRGMVLQAVATKITETHVEFDREIDEFGFSIPYEYLVYATGCQHPEPGNLNAYDSKDQAIKRLEYYRKKISESKSILIVGGGAVGVELAAEIKEHYPEKQVTLVHSRSRYLPLYKEEMHNKIFAILEKFGVKQILQDRVILTGNESGTFVTKSGLKIDADLMIPCTGMKPNSELIQTLSPDLVNESKFVKCSDTLQVPGYPNIFVGGDVADLQDVKVGFAAFAHGDVILENISKLIDPDATTLYEKLLQCFGAEKGLRKHKTVLPQIGLFLGSSEACGQYALGSYLRVKGTKDMKSYFTNNVGADRLWGWLNHPMK